MARLAAEAKAGYYPAPTDIVLQIARVVRPLPDPNPARPMWETSASHILLDPCCGEGEAVATLADEWFRSHGERGYTVYACELEKGRHEKAKSKIGTWRNNVQHGDAFGLLPTEDSSHTGATILYLNPPYATDKEYKRLEERWLQRFTNMLRPGGALIFLVPGYALADSAVTLAQWYTDITVYRLDAKNFEAYKQVVLVARKRGGALPAPDPRIVAQMSAPIESLPVLADVAGYGDIPLAPEQVAANALEVQPCKDGGFKEWAIASFDLAGLISKHRPWTVSKAGGKFASNEKVEPVDAFGSVCLRTYNVAVSPRASHIAAGIAAGVFNGVRITSATEGLPPLYIKGAFTRDFETVETKYNDKGEATSLLQHQKPKLNITVLDTSVSPPVYRTLRSETTISESAKLDDSFTIGDLLLHYGESLLSVLLTRCPTLYPYSTPLRAYDSPRTLFSAQSHATAACLKLLKQPDKAAFLLGEIGSGKSTVSLVSAVTHGAKRILIVAPPHLMQSWQDQAAAVLPGAATYILTRPSDLDLVSAENPNRVTIGIMSRETAKLGHAYGGLLACSTCGTPTELKIPPRDPKTPPEKYQVAVELFEQKARDTATRLRKRCGAKFHTPANSAGKIAVQLCNALHALFPEDSTIQVLVPRKLRELMGKLVESGSNRVEQGLPEAAFMPVIEGLATLLCKKYNGKGLDNSNGFEALERTLLALILCFKNVDIPARVALDKFVPHALKIKAHKITSQYNARAKFLALIQAILLIMEDGRTIDLYAQRLGGPAIDPENEIQEADAPAAGDDATPAPGEEEDEDSTPHYSYYSQLYYPWDSYKKFAAHLLSGAPEKPYNIYNDHLGFSEGEITLGSCIPRTHSMARYALSKLLEVAKWSESKPCHSVMYTAIPQPRRFPLARYIVKQRRHLFDFLLVDEAHEYANQDSAQSQAVQQLYGLKVPTIILTGSVTNGYASSLFVPLWYLSTGFRAEFKRGDIDKFVKRYGYVKRVIDLASGQVKEHGAMSARKEATRISGQIPGVMPELVLRHLLPLAATIHLEDIEGEKIGDGTVRLPACEEIVIRVPLNAAQERACVSLRDRLIAQIKADRFSARRGKLFGQLAELPSMPDRFTEDTGSDGGPDLPGDGHYTIRYPHPDNEVVASAKCQSKDTILPKEAELIKQVLKARERGRRVMVFPWHIALMPRLARLLRAHGLNVAELYSTKVPSKKRQAWIDKNVVGKNVDVLFVNPVAVQTGLNNLVFFSTVIWYENPGCMPNVRRQARGRVKRIGQLQDVESITLIYEGPGALQPAAHTLLLHKVGIGEAVDGLDPTAALAAAGVGDTDSTLAQGIGAALYKMITQGKA